MTDTIISSATKEVVIGFGRPFVMIGERINPTGRKLLAEEMKNGDFSRVVADAIAQVEAGAQMLDVNAGIPLADEPAAGRQVFELVGRLRNELGVNTTCGASNVSFGLPNRHHITGNFLSMAIGAGMTSAIMSPLHEEVKNCVMAADVLNGHDENCAAWIAANRDPNAGGGAGGARRRSGGRRRAGAAG